MTHPTPRLTRPRPLDGSSVLELPYADAGIRAGFPSPAQDYLGEAIDLNRELVPHKEATFYARVTGDSMRDAGILDGDLVVIDKSLEARDGDCVVACIEGEFTIKTYREDRRRRCAWLMPANPAYPPIKVTADTQAMIWGVVTYTIRDVRSGRL